MKLSDIMEIVVIDNKGARKIKNTKDIELYLSKKGDKDAND